MRHTTTANGKRGVVLLVLMTALLFLSLVPATTMADGSGTEPPKSVNDTLRDPLGGGGVGATGDTYDIIDAILDGMTGI